MVLLVFGIVLITAAIFWPSRSEPDVAATTKPWRFPTLTGVRAHMPEAPVAAAAANAGAVAVAEASAAEAIRWPLLIDETATELERLERLRIIESFTFVPGPWAAGILTQAYDEERDDLREAAVVAIAECGTLAEPVLARALRSQSAAERALAVDGYAKIGILEPVIPLLDDPSLPVATSAAYALVRAQRSDVIDAHFAAQADAERLEEIRAVLSALA
jgi:hypothetical protein